MIYLTLRRPEHRVVGHPSPGGGTQLFEETKVGGARLGVRSSRLGSLISGGSARRARGSSATTTLGGVLPFINVICQSAHTLIRRFY